MHITTTTLGVHMTGSSTHGIKTVLVPGSDLATAKALYAALLGYRRTDECRPPLPR